jgi:hypothetical protein
MGYHQKQVDDLRVNYCNKIEEWFQFVKEVEFNNPFVVYVTEENSYDDSSVKASHIVKTIVDGKYLTGESMGSEFDDLSIYDLEDINEVAYILDTVTSRQYKILETNE